ncbi:TPA: hypothetical protein KYK53_001593 [Salmonella enterica subsp. enterica serovar Dublin]|nr:hypothetical protein [Salmonella enterica subsp. enterica serovar Dublin]
MAQQVDGAAMPLDTEKVGIKGYLAFFLTIIFFSGVFSGSEGWWRVFDFTVLNGSFGHVTGTQTFRGAGGTGAKDGFLFALELAQEGEITERDKVIFAAWQTSGSAIITNYFSSGVAVFAFLGTSVIIPLVVILLFKFIGANLLRVWINIEERRHPAQGAQS